MNLIERDNFLEILQRRFKKISEAEGHCFFITGEAGIGKTSLVKAFLTQVEEKSITYAGACDSLFVPRPLAPLYDVASQIKKNWTDNIYSVSSVTELFTKFVEEFSGSALPVVLVFEDIHWADEGTLDFIKFFARRISRMQCMFILTSRNDEINKNQPLRNLLGDLSADTFTRIELKPLSKESVERLAHQKGYNAENVYNISGGNPFYVTEILASYSPGIPENIKDAILAVYNRQDEATKSAWQLLSVIPEGLEIEWFAKIDVVMHPPIENCLESKILVVENGRIYFKHELYRRTIENSLSPFKRIALHKNLLQLFLTAFEEKGEIERIVHHAKNASENNLVFRYAPIAAKHAASVGSHLEAAKLFLTAIEYYDKKDLEKLVKLFEDYAYECYLTNQVKDAIIYQTKALKIRKEKNIEMIGNGLRFLSRLWWFDGNHQNAEKYGMEAISVLQSQPSSKGKAMAYSNMSQLKMLAEKTAECIELGETAIKIAKEIKDDETLCHALNNIGTAQIKIDSTEEIGNQLLMQSLRIALQNSFEEHAARAYTNIISTKIAFKQYDVAKDLLQEGLKYCEERELDSWTNYKRSWKTKMLLETGDWDQAMLIAENLLTNGRQTFIIKIGAMVTLALIKSRRGEPGAMAYLVNANLLAAETKEHQRIIPAMIASLEYEWLTSKRFINDVELKLAIDFAGSLDHIVQNSEFDFWLQKARGLSIGLPDLYKPYKLLKSGEINAAADFWQKKGCQFEKALALAEGGEDEKREALIIFKMLGAEAVYKKVQMQMRAQGIKRIPRGIRSSTKHNPAGLTNRELDVLRLLKNGNQNKDIADELFVSTKTVDHHISSILFKLDVNSRGKAVEEGIRLGIFRSETLAN